MQTIEHLQNEVFSPHLQHLLRELFALHSHVMNGGSPSASTSNIIYSQVCFLFKVAASFAGA